LAKKTKSTLNQKWVSGILGSDIINSDSVVRAVEHNDSDGYPFQYV